MQPGTWRSIALIYVFAELIAACHGKSLALVSDVGRTFQVEAATASWVIGAVAVAAAVLSPVGGWLIDRLGELRAIRFGLVVAMIASFGGCLAQTFTVLIAFRLAEGVGYIAVVLGALALLIRTTEGTRQTTALALWSVASPMGGALAILCVSPLVGSPQWQLVFAFHAALLFGALLLTPLLPRPIARERLHEPVSRALSIYASPPVRLFLGAIVLVQVFKLGSGSVLPTFLMNEHGVPAAWMGAISVASIALSVVGGILAGALFNRGISPFGIAGVSAVISGIGSGVIYTTGLDMTVVLAAILISAVSGGVMFAWITSTIPKIAPDPARIGATAGAVTQLLYLSMAIGPAVMFFILHQPSRLPLFLLIAAAYGLPLLILGWQRYQSRERTTAVHDASDKVTV
jgi:predicted MFS family arabinose efflux permease